MKQACLLLLFLAFLVIAPVSAQEVPPASTEQLLPAPKSPRKALGLSILLPGLGHRYAQSGSWKGAATAFALADVGFWVGLFGAQWRHDQTVQSYETLAAGRASAQIEGKDRRFFLNMALFYSSQEYLDTQLRNRAWDQIDYVSDPSFQWQWSSDEDLQKYRELRDEADSWGRRRALFISALVANRLIAGLTSIRAANRANQALENMQLSFAPPPRHEEWPVVHLSVRF